MKTSEFTTAWLQSLNPGRFLPRLLLMACPALIISPLTRAENHATVADPRVAHSAAAPAWLDAVGKLEVAGQRMESGRRQHYLQDCSATLVAGKRTQDADTIVSAWHCFEHYNDLTRPITFVLRPAHGEELSRQARLLDSGGGMHSDWAILRLDTAIPSQRVAPLQVNPGRASRQQPIVMAGYSRDDGLGAAGEVLTYHADCHIVRQAAAGTHSDCRAYRGASGGAVVQADTRGQHWFSGVISAGNGADTSIFVPVTSFRAVLDRFL